MVYHKIGTLKPHRMLREGMIPDHLLQDEKEERFKPVTSNPLSVTDDGFLDLYFNHDRDQQLKLISRRMAASNGARSTGKREKRELKEIADNEKILDIIRLFDT